ncbi:hypothetical protein EON65_54740 [archaeon]|nr:MAG: hypothetical protein EON65_54740 [archaeon]
MLQPVDSFRKEAASSTKELFPALVTPVPVHVAASIPTPTSDKSVKSDGVTLQSLLVLVIILIVLQVWLLMKLSALQGQVGKMEGFLSK